MMQFEAVFGVFIISLLSVGSALVCNHCGSRERWSMCNNNIFQRECKPWEDRCYKASVDTTLNGERITRFVKGCTTEKQCIEGSMEDCLGGENKGTKLPCVIDCCAGKLCNSATLPLTSGTVLLMCTVLAIIFH